MKTLCIALLLLMLNANFAFSEIPIKDWDTVKKDQAIILYLNGVAKGLFWTDIIAGDKQKIKLWCPPTNMTLNANNVISIVESQIDLAHKMNSSPETPIEMLLIDGLIKAFPCRK